MSQEEFDGYLDRMTNEAEAYTDEVEKKTGTLFNLFIAHHTFTNPVVLIELDRRRVAKGWFIYQSLDRL